MADSLSLNREVVRGVLCHDISSPAASLLGELIRLTQQLHIRELISRDVNKFKGHWCPASTKSILLRRGTVRFRSPSLKGVDALVDGLDALALSTGSKP